MFDDDYFMCYRIHIELPDLRFWWLDEEFQRSKTVVRCHTISTPTVADGDDAYTVACMHENLESI